MKTFELALLSAVGLLCLSLGLVIWRKQRIGLIHDYHWVYVRAEDKAAYTKGIGRALALLGLGIMLAGVVNTLTGTAWGWLVFAVGFAYFIVRVTLCQRRYNRRADANRGEERQTNT